MFAYVHATLEDETIKLTGFSSGAKLFAFIKGFFGPKGLQNFFTQHISLFLNELIRQGSALVCIDDILLMLNSKPHLRQPNKQVHDNAFQRNLKLATEKTFFSGSSS